MTVKGGSRPACAACRFQRRRCSPDCPLAPYFPANQPKIFQNVHRLFGVGNIMKILNQLKDNEQKQEAMKSIKYESYIREVCPVDGCYGTIIHLYQQLVLYTRELQYVQAQLAAYREASIVHGEPPPVQDYYHPSSQLHLGITPPPVPVMNEMNSGHRLLDENQVFSYGESNDNSPPSNSESKQLFVYQQQQQQPVYNNCEDHMRNNVNFMEIQAQLTDFQSCDIQQGGGVEEGQISPDNYDDETVFDSFADDQQSYVESKQVCQSRHYDHDRKLSLLLSFITSSIKTFPRTLPLQKILRS